MDQPPLSSLYQTLILDHYRHPRNRGEIGDETVAVHVHNPVCGDEIKLQLKVEGDVIESARFVGTGCSISQAAVSMMTGLITGKKLSDADALAALFTRMMHGDAEAAPSVANLGFANNEGSFLAGAAAAMKSKTGTVGFVGGEAGTGLIERSQAGFEAGAREVDPEVRLLVTYLGEDPSAFDDPVAARSAAATMYASGADVIAHDAGASGVGVFEAAADVQALAIGADVDETLLVPLELQEVILTSVVDRVDVAVEDAIRAVTADTFVGGFHAYGIAEGGVDLAVNEINATPRLLSDAMRLRLDELAARVVAGEIVVPVVPEVEPELPTAPAVPSVSPTAPSTIDPSGTGSP